MPKAPTLLVRSTFLLGLSCFALFGAAPAGAYYLCPNSSTGPNVCLTYCEAMCGSVACGYSTTKGYGGYGTTVTPQQYDPEYYCAKDPKCPSFTVYTSTNAPGDPLTTTAVTKSCHPARCAP